LALGRVGEQDSSIEELVRTRMNDPDEQTRINATISMTLLGKWNHDVIPILAKALSSSNESVAKGSSKALYIIGEKKPDLVIPVLLEALSAETPVAAVHALPALKKLKKVSAGALPKIVEMYDKSDAETKSDILDAVAVIDESGDYAIPLCLKALNEENPLDRREALISLMRFRGKASNFLDEVIQGLEDKDVENRALALGILRGSGADLTKAAPQIARMVDDSDMRVKNSAVATLGNISPPSTTSLQALQKALRDKDYRTRIAAVNALRILGASTPTEIIPVLKDALESESYDPVKRILTSALENLNKKNSSSN
jgi:HEAT repeat protein